MKRPRNRLTVQDVHGDSWEASFHRSSGYELFYLRWRRQDSPSSHNVVINFPRVRPIPGTSAFTVSQEEQNPAYAKETYPPLSRETAERLLEAARDYIYYYEAGESQARYVQSQEKKLGRAVKVGQLDVWRNPSTPHVTAQEPPLDKLDVFIFPDSGTDTLRLSSSNWKPVYTHASTLAGRYANFFDHPEKVRQARGDDLILVYPVGLETYYVRPDGYETTARIGLYAKASEVYNVLWEAWHEQQRGWRQPEAGPRAMPNFPFDVELLYGESKDAPRAQGRIEYVGKNREGIPQFEVTVDLTRSTPSSHWVKRQGTLNRPRTFYTDLKMLQRTPLLFTSKDLLKWQHLNNPDGKEENFPKLGARLSPESHQLVLVALDARFEAGLTGLAGIKDIRMGRRVPPQPHSEGVDYFDFSHLLPEGLRKQVRLETEVKNHGTYLRINGYLSGPGEESIGRLLGHLNLDERTLVVEDANIHEDWRGKQLGKALYEAVYRTAYRFGARAVRGGTHSTMAHRVHESLASKHGWNYNAFPNREEYGEDWPNEDWNAEPEGDGARDDRWSSYRYTLSGAEEERDEYGRRKVSTQETPDEQGSTSPRA